MIRLVSFFIATFCWLFSLRLSSQTALPPWQPGMMDIHHISTGRGNAAFFIFPDGSTMLVDAGEISDTHPRTLSPRNGALRPDSSRRASAWVADYIRQFHPAHDKVMLDYAVITHFHDDHFGEWDASKPRSSKGDYALTGLMGVGDEIPIRHLLDRGTHFPVDVLGNDFAKQYEKDEYHIVQTLREYQRYIRWQQAHNGLRYDTIQPGVCGQIKLKNETAFPDFRVQNIAAGGRIWTGFRDGEFTEMYKYGTYPGENPLSVCLKISYGPFDYFTGGDISGVDDLGQANLHSMEAQVAPVVGPVDVATLNHHGNRDSQSPFYVKTLRPKVWIQQCWSSDHPGEEVLRRITSRSLYPGERMIFTTDMLQSNILVIGDKVHDTYSCLHGHVVVRVMPGGKTYQVYVLNDFSAKREVIGQFGPFLSR